MVEDTKHRLTSIDLAAGRKTAQRELSKEDIESPEAVEFYAHYTALNEKGLSYAHSLEVAAGMTKRAAAADKVSTGGLDEFINRARSEPARIPNLIAGIHEHYLSVNKNPPSEVEVDGHFYERQSTVDYPWIIGCDQQVNYVTDEVRRVFMYDPASRKSTEQGARDKGILFFGPPGTGKSSLVKYAIAEAQMLAQKTGRPFSFEQFRPADYSKWSGESAQRLSEKFREVSDSRGVGIFALDDLDMTLQSRDDATSSHGGLQVTNQFMQEVSSIKDVAYDNVLFFGTTNRLDKVDDAIRSRFSTFLEVPGYTRLDEHRLFVDEKMPWADDSVRSSVAQYSFSHSLAPRSLDQLVSHIDKRRRGVPSVELLCLPPEERFAKRREQYEELSVSAVDEFLASYVP